MRAFLYNNPLVMLFIIVVLILIVLYLFFKKLPTKGKKKTTDQKSKEDIVQKIEPEERHEDVEKISTEEQVDVDPVVEISEDTNKKKGKSVTKIYQRPVEVTVKKETDEALKQSQPNAEFINISKNVARFKKIVEEPESEYLQEPVTDEFGFVQDVQEDCDFCENKVKHFDHTKRLSNFIRDDNFDDMFQSHISDYYMNMNDIDRHINYNNKSLDALYDKASETINNSQKKIISDVVEESIIRSEIEENQGADFNEGFYDNVSLKSIVLSDVVMNRKKKK